MDENCDHRLLIQNPPTYIQRAAATAVSNVLTVRGTDLVPGGSPSRGTGSCSSHSGHHEAMFTNIL